jgi:hypothetical protein
MRTSEQIHDLVTALAKARAAFDPITRSKTVTVRGERGSYQFSYAPLEAILDAVTEPLSAHGLVLVSGIEYGPDGAAIVTTRLLHATGQWLESHMNVGRPGKMQEFGSALTYARRYTITGLLGIAADDDDDANAADGNTITAATTRPSPGTNGQASESSPAHPTTEQIDDLFHLAESCREPKEAFGSQLRRLMGLSGETRISKAFLLRTMTVEQYRAARAYYEAQLKAQIEADVPDHAPPAQDAEAVAKAQLRAEVATWGLAIAPAEIEYILAHYAPEKARALLEGHRERTKTATAAD